MDKVLSVNFVLGQDDIPLCFAFGECALSSSFIFWEVNTISECLSKCKETIDCEFFNYYETGGAKNSCNGLANCGFYSSDTCIDCYVGKKSCSGKNEQKC